MRFETIYIQSFYCPISSRLGLSNQYESLYQIVNNILPLQVLLLQIWIFGEVIIAFTEPLIQKGRYEERSTAVVGIVVLVAIMILGIFMSWWTLSSVLLNIIPFFLAAGIIGLFVWGFKKRIDAWFNRDVKPSSVSSHLIERLIIHKENVGETKPEGVTKRLGNPDYIQNGIQHYGNRSRLPLEDLFAEAQQRIDMLAVTFHTLTTNEIQRIRESLYRGVQITFVILDPNAKQAINRNKDFHEGEEVKYHIERSLHVLCEEKKNLPVLPHTDLRNYLIIKTYDNVVKHSIIIIDNKLIKIEEHLKGSSPDTRPSSLAFKDDNKSFFEQYSTEYRQIYSTKYNCPSY